MSGLDKTGTKFPNGLNASKILVNDLLQPRSVLSGTITFDPPSLTTGGFATSAAIPIVGIALGDSIDLYPPYSTQGIMYQATPSSAGNMIINLFNASAGTLDLASGSWGYAVKRRI